MTTTINASTSSGLVQTADTSGILQLQTANTAALTISAAQAVGLGTASPVYKLDILGNNGDGIRITDTTNSVQTGITSYNGQAWFASLSNHPVVLGVNGGEKMRITSAGNVGIGTSAPGVKLHVMEQASADLGVAFEAATAGYAVNMTLYGNTASGSRYNNITCKYGSTEQWYIGGNGTDATIAFRTSTTERARINAYGIGLGGAIPSSGTGITFPAAQSASSDANTLDDYEEGTWTVVPTFGGNNTGMTLSVQSGSYVKVGRTVFIQARVTFTNKGSSTGSFNFYGLPFTSASGNGFYSGVSISYQGNFNNGSTWSVQQHPVIDTNNTYILFRYANGTGGSADHNNNDVSNTSDIIVWGFYQTT